LRLFFPFLGGIVCFSLDKKHGGCAVKDKNRYTFPMMAKATGIPQSTLQRICADNQCKKLVEAYKIIKMTSGQVGMEDLLPDGEMI
jgi:hypothetical protein